MLMQSIGSILAPVHAVQAADDRGPNLLVDGNMDAAGVGDWTIATATFTKETDDPAQGARYGKIVATDAVGGRIQQLILTATNTYRVTGVYRGDGGSGYIELYNPSATPAAIIAESTTSDTWQEFDVTFTAGHPVFRIYVRGGLGMRGDADNVYVSLE